LKREGSKSPNILVVALSTTVAVCAVISIFTFIVGFLCGRYSRAHSGKIHKLKETQTPRKLPEPPLPYDRTPSLDPPIASQPAAVPLYEDVDAVKRQGKDLELKENAAYQHFKSTSSD
jgi:hypothetical protein